MQGDRGKPTDCFTWPNLSPDPIVLGLITLTLFETLLDLGSSCVSRLLCSFSIAWPKKLKKKKAASCKLQAASLTGPEGYCRMNL